MRALACLLLAASVALPAAAQPVGDFETRKSVEYATHDGVRLTGDLYLPKAAGPHPGIVAIHGGGWQAGAPFGETSATTSAEASERFFPVARLDHVEAVALERKGEEPLDGFLVVDEENGR